MTEINFFHLTITINIDCDAVCTRGNTDKIKISTLESSCKVGKQENIREIK